MPNQIEQLYQKTRNHTALQSLIVLESTLSYPIPHQSGTEMYLRFLFFDKGRTASEAGTVPIYRPYARVSITYPKGTLVEYIDLGFESGQPVTRLGEVIGEYPHAAMANLDFKAAKARRTALFYYTQQIIPLYGRTDLTAAEIQTVQTYWDTFDQVAELPLRSYYEALSPAFFAWIHNIVG
ncbi:MAG TPA: hypothetical protein PKZ84_11480 [Anaerolineae bacterium]|nr:hypothetical protein [Anaerolineae bacterium]